MKRFASTRSEKRAVHSDPGLAQWSVGSIEDDGIRYGLMIHALIARTIAIAPAIVTIQSMIVRQGWGIPSRTSGFSPRRGGSGGGRGRGAARSAPTAAARGARTRRRAAPAPLAAVCRRRRARRGLPGLRRVGQRLVVPRPRRFVPRPRRIGRPLDSFAGPSAGGSGSTRGGRGHGSGSRGGGTSSRVFGSKDRSREPAVRSRLCSRRQLVDAAVMAREQDSGTFQPRNSGGRV